MGESTRLDSFNYAEGDFESLLEDARMLADDDVSEGFVARTIESHKEWGTRMFWSSRQDAWLHRIVDGD